MERLIKTEDVADMLSVSPSRARKILAERGVRPVDVGRGRGGGLRWPMSLVQAMVQSMISPPIKKRHTHRCPTALDVRIADLSADDLFALTHKPRLSNGS